MDKPAPTDWDAERELTALRELIQAQAKLIEANDLLIACNAALLSRKLCTPKP